MRGVSLLETTIALGFFVLVAMATANILIAAKNAQFKASAIQSVVDNVRFGLETITKELRTGTGFILVACNGQANTQINFRDQFNNAIGYAFYDPPDPDGTGSQPDPPGGIYKINDWVVDPNCVNGTPITASEVVVEALRIVADSSGNIVGTGPNDGQPRLTLSFKAKAFDPKLKLYTTMNLQTTVTQRVRDINQ